MAEPELEFPPPPNTSWPPVDEDGYPDVDRHSCQLLGPTALIVQGLMGILVILSLIYKRHREKPMRPWKIWLFDVSKQIVGQMFVHGVNVLISDLLSHFSSENACVSYFLNILVDTTLGVALIYLILHVLTHIFSENLHLQGFESGIYGSPPRVKFWARQATLYVVALTTMKFLVIGLLALFPGIFKIGAWLLSWTWTDEGDAVQVIFVMGIFPIFMNILQFWLIDSIVKASSSPVALDADAPDSDNPDREPLFGVSSDDDDENNNLHPQHDVQHHRPRSQSRNSVNSRSHSRDKSITFSDNPYESKSSGSTSRTEIVEAHSYPPSLTSSLKSTSSTSSIREANKLNKKRRPPPAPLNLSPRPVPTQSKPVTRLTTNNAPVVVDPSKDEWEDTWRDE
ncbi:vacuolar membrane protein-domain-containing protein [Lentinula aciculospora]|uniref:Vacuolar membrane protein-domain-containing protein n=1 Tax=Lentinula aciculospora TaxID=153920 RepID=A0A9W9ABS5_9AGAR|nr:vacuolar membrane protein-domain-containing protein [Lentinula aciculospora]